MQEVDGISEIRWFGWREVKEALAFSRSGGIALHHFHWDLRKFGLGPADPVCHVVTTSPRLLLGLMDRFGVPERALHPPRPYRPDIWHFDAFGHVLEAIKAAYPPPPGVEGRTGGERAS